MKLLRKGHVFDLGGLTVILSWDDAKVPVAVILIRLGLLYNLDDMWLHRIVEFVRLGFGNALRCFTRTTELGISFSRRLCFTTADFSKDGSSQIFVPHAQSSYCLL